MVFIGFWMLAGGVLFYKCGGIFCNNNSNQTLTQTIGGFANDTSPVPPQIAALQSSVSSFADLVGSGWFGMAFLALLVLSSVILVRSIKVSVDETRAGKVLPARVREEGTIAVQDALKVLEMQEISDPRTRIMACYERMIRAAASLGANVGVDQTARELERGIRNTFQLKGSGIRELTRLFEEARYSLHPITETDSQQAILCLHEIGEELRATMMVEN